jgi:ankyrin repeat protein
MNIHNIVAGQQQVNRRTMEGETPLLLACMFQGSTELVQLLLDCGANVNLGNNENHTPLHEGMIVVMVCYNNVLFWLHVSQIKKCWEPWSGVTGYNVSIISMAYVVGCSKQSYAPSGADTLKCSICMLKSRYVAR